ncbi:ABC transporter permease subunit [Anaerocolumna sedimenticola]|uniref:ABC transporter permease subunit n=1 Tax=Anaerocolumna sedimenticola TaxID=2696063 RepID=A0A6P1TU09_9FIRM|nr:ABC transporter permease subunit [Anaerocolumna sedimenticola]QHQ62978.1 ABC transporter permease subunit [Anaerocolumna sedimenticola]
MKIDKLWSKLTALFLIILVACFILYLYSGQNSNILNESNIKTGLQNNCLAYDQDQKIMIVGTYNNMLKTFDKQDNLLWELEAKGPFCQMVVNEQKRIVYAGNEDNNIYIVNLDTGELINTINVQRRVYGIDVTEDGSEMLISAGVSTNKHNILIYSYDGEQVKNLQYKTRIQGVSYTAGDENIIFINNRGEIIKINKNGDELAKLATKYELVSLSKAANKEIYAALCGDGSYVVFDDNLQLLRQGKINTMIQVTSSVIGIDTDGNNVAVGTEEGYLYILNNKDQQVFTQRLSKSITGIMSTGDSMYITGLGDFIMRISTGSLNNISLLVTCKKVSMVVGIAALIFSLISFLMAIPKANRCICRFGKTLVKYRTAYILLFPTFLLLLFFNYIPVGTAVGGAFTNWSKDFNTWSELKFVGLENFKLMISEGYFIIGVSNLILMTICGLIKVLTVPLLVAWLVYSLKSPKAKYGFRFLFVLPMVVPGVVSTLMWQQIYNPTIGMLNQVLKTVGLENLQHVWLGDPKTAIWAIIFMGFPFINALAFLVYYAGFINIDASLYEAAKVDGATRGKIFFQVQLPMISGEIFMMVILTFIGVVQDYTSIYILTGGGPGTSTYVPGLELYFNATKFGRYGYACALGLVMFIVIMSGTLLNMRVKSKRD